MEHIRHLWNTRHITKALSLRNFPTLRILSAFRIFPTLRAFPTLNLRIVARLRWDKYCLSMEKYVKSLMPRLASPSGLMATDHAHLLLPRTSLSDLLFAAVIRDARGEHVPAEGFFSCIPAVPLCSVTWIYGEGELHFVNAHGEINPVSVSPVFVAGPKRRPIVSWNAAPACSMTVGFYADAWTILTSIKAGRLVDLREPHTRVLRGELSQTFHTVHECGNFEEGFRYLQDTLDPIWQKARLWQSAVSPQRLEDWTQALIARAARSGPGKSERQIQRRIKSWTGLTQRELRFHAQAEKSLLSLSHLAPPDLDLVKMAAEAGYADQSHMGRAIRRITGASPARVSQLIQSDTRYWMHRLINSRLQTPIAENPPGTVSR
jgi:AraC-like DNA-binding protein